MSIVILGIDLGKNSCSIVGLDADGAVVVRRRMLSPEYVRPYVKAQKNDDRDAEAIAEAATRPTMRFVEIKSEEQLDVQTLHRVRDRLVGERTSLTNQIRSLLLGARAHCSTRPCPVAPSARWLAGFRHGRVELTHGLLARRHAHAMGRTTKPRQGRQPEAQRKTRPAKLPAGAMSCEW